MDLFLQVALWILGCNLKKKYTFVYNFYRELDIYVK